MTSTEILTAFHNHLTEDGKGPATIASYTADVKGYLQYFKDKRITFQGQMKRFQVTSYKKHLSDNNYQVNTINKKINSLQCFNHFLIIKKLMTDTVVDLKKDKIRIANGSEKEVSTLTEEEIEKLLFHIQDNSKVSARVGFGNPSRFPKPPKRGLTPFGENNQRGSHYGGSFSLLAGRLIGGGNGIGVGSGVVARHNSGLNIPNYLTGYSDIIR